MNSTTIKRWVRVFKFNVQTGSFKTDTVNLEMTERTPAKTILVYRTAILDMILFVVICKAHKRLLLRQFDRKLYYFPLYSLPASASWIGALGAALVSLLRTANIPIPETIRPEILRYIQIKVPKFSEILIQLVMVIRLPDCQGKCISSIAGEYKWFRMDEVKPPRTAAVVTEFWGPEPYIWTGSGNGPGQPPEPTKAIVLELSILNEVKQFAKRWNLVMNTEYSERDVVKIFEEYVQLIYPSLWMNWNQFSYYLEKTKIDMSLNGSISGHQNLFQAFCGHNSGYTTFKEFLLTLVCMDKKCVHGSVGGELRTRAMYYYYTKTPNHGITYQELQLVFKDVQMVKHQQKQEAQPTRPPASPSPEAPKDASAATVEKLYASLGYSPTKSIPIEKFVELVGRLKIRGTSCLFRMNRSFLTQFQQKKLYSPMFLKEVAAVNPPHKTNISLKVKRKQCKRCSRQFYHPGIHSVLVDLLTETAVWEKELTDEAQQNQLPKLRRTTSLLDVSNATSSSTYQYLRLVLIRFSRVLFGHPRIPDPKAKLAKWEKPEERIPLVDKIIKVCREVRELFQNGPRILRVQSPVYIFGDIHGNLRDLMIYDHLFWKLAPAGYVCNSLFLGDYVDRGDLSVECILYLFCLKLLVPDRFSLLRGNHESRLIQQQFTFYRECMDKFRSQGVTVWESFNSAFDCMPVCALVDEQIFCAHGGIPTSTKRLENLVSIPNNLPNVNQNKTAWEILWNDPVSRSDYKEFIGMFQIQDFFTDFPKGFLPNIKRGTAYYYSEDAVDNFFELNNIVCVIRAHEVIPIGFQFHFDGKVITIFSCSNYCGGTNESSVAYIDNQKLRIIRIETHKQPVLPPEPK